MGSTSCTAHRLEIRRALYLITSNKKFILLIEVEFMGKIGKIGKIGVMGLCYPRLIVPIVPILLIAPIDPINLSLIAPPYIP